MHFSNSIKLQGLTDVQDIVHKFLTREQTYSSLLVTISQSEQKIDQSKLTNEELSSQVHQLKINNDGENLKILYEDVDSLNK